MSNNVLPSLSEWFEVPAGATVPAYTTYTVLWSDGSHYATKDNNPFRVAEAGRFFTEKPIEAVKETLEDVIREGVGGAHTPAEIAKAVEAFYAEQKQKQLKVIVDNGGDVWRLNAVGTYDLWYDDLTGMILQDLTRERIKNLYGIKEERY